MNRLGIYFFYDKDGIVDRYVFHFLEKMKEHCSELMVVVNGYITTEGKNELEKIASKTLLRDNEGFDVGAYKAGIEYYGYEQIKEYDEVIFFNFTFFGPFFPLSEMFDKMHKSTCDLWSVFKWPIYNDDEGKMAFFHHLPSFFIVYRQSILSSVAFQEYWDNLPDIHSYDDSVNFHEQCQTPFFENKGFKTDCYIDNLKYKPLWKQHWPMLCADRLIIEDRYPFLKRRHLYVEDGHMFWDINTFGFVNTINYIKQYSDYDIDMIHENINRTQPIDSLIKKRRTFKNLRRLILSKLHPNKLKRKEYQEKLLYDANIVTYQDFLTLFKKPR